MAPVGLTDAVLTGIALARLPAVPTVERVGVEVDALAIVDRNIKIAATLRPFGGLLRKAHVVRHIQDLHQPLSLTENTKQIPTIMPPPWVGELYWIGLLHAVGGGSAPPLPR